MTVATDMLRTSPNDLGYDESKLAECIAACFDCVQACRACADACLGEDEVGDLRACITLDLNCADQCDATGSVLSRQTSFDATVSNVVLLACIEVCRRCAAECDRHAERHDHCLVCADACRRCEQACRALAS